MDNATNTSTGVAQQLQDVNCVPTSRSDLETGYGFWVCSYRDQGQVAPVMGPVEVTESWWQFGSVYPGDVAELSPDQVEAFLADPEGWWLQNG